jgi:hypothetical protein
MKIAVVRVVVSCNLVEVYRRFRGTSCLYDQGAHRAFYQTTRRYNPEDSHRHHYY